MGVRNSDYLAIGPYSKLITWGRTKDEVKNAAIALGSPHAIIVHASAVDMKSLNLEQTAELLGAEIKDAKILEFGGMPMALSIKNKTKLNDLYTQITEAIFRSELIENKSSPEYIAIISKISKIEEQIADILPPDNTEGEIARHSAVTNAFLAKENERALKLVYKYYNETNATTRLINKLRKLE
jgi:hypothetical protein